MFLLEYIMFLILAGVVDFLWGVGGTLATAALLGVFGWAWHMNSLMTELKTLVQGNQELWNARFNSLQKEVEDIKAEMSEIRRSVK
jgi:hypothetical protein